MKLMRQRSCPPRSALGALRDVIIDRDPLHDCYGDADPFYLWIGEPAVLGAGLFGLGSLFIPKSTTRWANVAVLSLGALVGIVGFGLWRSAAIKEQNRPQP